MTVLYINNYEIHHSEINLYTNISILIIVIVNLSDRSLQLYIIKLTSFLLKGGTTLIAQLSWVIYLTLPLTRNRPATDPQV